MGSFYLDSLQNVYEIFALGAIAARSDRVALK